ncbi:Mg2+ transporter protein [Macleaya cordata]|uniref:Magnesium transporter n=1 Tax=Macleaya cordata TaxID=56857 RepID=A0A200QJS6_MACCD|nr:Mg2+ transporter protein [Macleaya cordata]
MYTIQNEAAAPDGVGGGGAIGSSRRKGSGVRAGLLIDATGEAQVVEEEKQSIMRRTGLPARDLRVLDPVLSYPPIILCRERAIVFNLEHIKAIITSHEVLLLNFTDPLVTPLVEELQIRLLRVHTATTRIQEGRVISSSSDETDQAGNLICDSEGLMMMRSRIDDDQGGPSNNSGGFQKCSPGKTHGFENRDGLPFEFIALEACLEAACSCLHNEAITLEGEAYPALDKLASKISTLKLERVRQIKSRLMEISGRVQKVRDELENLLDDDEDMAEMYLTHKAMQHHLDGSSASSQSENNEMDDEFSQPDIDDMTFEISSDENEIPTYYEGDLQNIDTQDYHLLGIQNSISGESHGTNTTTTPSAISKQLDVEELQMLLEAHFVQIYGTLNKLSTLREYVDDTEDYINIMLDDKQNQLLQMGILLTTATLVLNVFVTVVGIFGMNIKIDSYKKESGRHEFLWITGGGATSSIILYALVITWCKHNGLLG